LHDWLAPTISAEFTTRVDVGVDYNHAFYFITPCFMVATIDESWALIFADSKESSRVEVQSFRIHFN